MQAQNSDRWAEGRHQSDAQQPDQQATEQHVGQRRGGVFEVDSPQEGVGGDECERLRRDTADSVAVCEVGLVRGGADRSHHDARERRHETEQHRAEQSFSPAGAVGEGIAHPCEPDTAYDGDGRGQEEDPDAPAQRPHIGQQCGHERLSPVCGSGE